MAAGAILTLLNQPSVVLLYTKVANGVPPELPANKPDPDNAAPVVAFPPTIMLAFDVILPVELVNPPVNKLPEVVFPVIVNDVNVPTDVILGCALV